MRSDRRPDARGPDLSRSPIPWLLVGGALVLALLPTATVDAARRAARWQNKIDPAIELALKLGLAPVGPWRSPAPLSTVPVIIEADRLVDDKLMREVERTGARIARVGGKPVKFRRFVAAEAPASALPVLDAIGAIVRVSLARPGGPPPLNVTTELIHVDGARGAVPKFGHLTGKGTLIADLDTLVDVFHPHFFHADGGWFDWIDSNNNGEFEPGKDFIDLDGDGVGSPSEVARTLRAETVMGYGYPVDARPKGFAPSVDWLYLDLNGNGRRDYGAAAGFDDDTLAFGEPLFVPDDVDHSEDLESNERLVRLGTSKIRMMLVDLRPYKNVHQTFTRGTDLTSVDALYGQGLSKHYLGLFGHGSGVMSIAVGGVPLQGRRWVGVAPEADAIIAHTPAKQGFAAIWLAQRMPDVLLHETAMWVYAPLDGSDAHSQLVDEAASQSLISQACPVGNHAGHKKHVRSQLKGGDSQSMDFVIKQPKYGGPLEQVRMAINARGSSPASVLVSLAPPDGPAFSPDSKGTKSKGVSVYGMMEVTPRDTAWHSIVLVREKDKAAMGEGTWTLTVSAPVGVTATVDSYVYDHVSGWGKGVAFKKNTSEAYLVGVPSTADHCVAVAAVAGNVAGLTKQWFGGYPESKGKLRNYSARGPRIDGVQKPDVGAPDNPWAASPPMESASPKVPSIPHGAMRVFGGTSGAGPHVAGTMALLASSGVRGDAARDALRDGATKMAGVVPDKGMGWGRLNAAGALGGVEDAKSPVVTLSSEPAVAGANHPFDLVVKVSGGNGVVQARWDDGYDGTWDTPFGSLAPRQVTVPTPGTQRYKVRVRDEAGRIAEAALLLVVVDKPAEPDVVEDVSTAGVTPEDGATTQEPEDPVPSNLVGRGCTADPRSPGRWPVGLLLLFAGLFLWRLRASPADSRGATRRAPPARSSRSWP